MPASFPSQTSTSFSCSISTRSKYLPIASAVQRELTLPKEIIAAFIVSLCHHQFPLSVLTFSFNFWYPLSVCIFFPDISSQYLIWSIFLILHIPYFAYSLFCIFLILHIPYFICSIPRP